MNIGDVFNDEMDVDHSGSSWGHLYHYWELEMMVSETNGNHFSRLEDFQDEKDRTCGLCGRVGNTCDSGLSVVCENKNCKMARDFWNMYDFARPLPQIGSGCVKRARSEWFRKQLFDQFGVKQIYKIPIEQRLSTVLALQLLRISVEQADEAIA